MTDTYAKLLGLSGNKTPPLDQAETKPSPSLPAEKKTRLLANQQTSKSAQPKVLQKLPKSPSAMVSPSLPSLQNTEKGQEDTSLLTAKEKTKYGTYLTNESIQKISIRAIQTNRDAHQIVQEAVNQYFKRLEK